MLIKTNSIYRDYNPNSNNPTEEKAKKGEKKKKGKKGKSRGKGIGVVVIPSEPNALLERLDLLLSSQEAGHTGVGNELVSICDELKRQGVLDTKTYKKLNSFIKK